ncbi:hypothetical protein [Streptomyces sp. NBC_00829]|uniref:hypothetical protein n=1 Tax=Streptomyces sp. NBC_00829 TaxID=2903679 RepID=UPI00386BF77A|nr:hypothetical protein OG293_23395 [Streptomyces sp. NBC_00829]
MSITLPTNLPAEDGQQTTAVSVPVQDLLSDYIHRASVYVPPLDSAREAARQALAEHEGASIHDHTSMIKAAVVLGRELRGLLASLDAVDGAA